MCFLNYYVKYQTLKPLRNWCVDLINHSENTHVICVMSAEDDYDYMQDTAALLNGRPKEFIIAVEQIVRICVKEFAESGSGQGGTE